MAKGTRAIPGQLPLEMRPQFITWKKYGWRHIVRDQLNVFVREDYSRSKVEYTEGKSLCGSDFWIPTKHEDERMDWVNWDIHDTRRPLCGTCRKSWKKQTGQEVD